MGRDVLVLRECDLSCSSQERSSCADRQLPGRVIVYLGYRWFLAYEQTISASIWLVAVFHEAAS
jgi:hypothetical protein